MSSGIEVQIQGNLPSNQISFEDPKHSDHTEIKMKFFHTESGPVLAYCDICSANVGHDTSDCPHREFAGGKYCRFCYGPCRKNWQGEHGEKINVLEYMIMRCALCGLKADHWAIDCPYTPKDEAHHTLCGSKPDHLAIDCPCASKYGTYCSDDGDDSGPNNELSNDDLYQIFEL